MNSDLYNNLAYSNHADRVNCLGKGILTFKKIIKYLEPKPGDKILEIGCNQGKTVKKIREYSQNVIGIDVNPEAVKRAEISDIIKMDGTKMDFPSNSFDKIYSSHTIEHIPDLNKFIREMERVLKPGGRILLVYPLELFRGCHTLIDALYIHKNPLMMRKLHLHRLTPNKIKKLVEGTSLEHKKSKFHFVPILSGFTLLEKKKGV